jgi:hypothetical protein
MPHLRDFDDVPLLLRCCSDAVTTLYVHLWQNFLALHLRCSSDEFARTVMHGTLWRETIYMIKNPPARQNTALGRHEVSGPAAAITPLLGRRAVCVPAASLGCGPRGWPGVCID